MTAYISESIRHYRIAIKIRDSINDLTSVSYAVVAHCAIYLEAVLNDIIFSWKTNHENNYPNFAINEELKNIDLYNEKINITTKLNGILFPNSDSIACQDQEYIEFKHLISIRNALFHLKPTEQLENGESKHTGPHKALKYLKQKKVIKSNPFGRGVFWADTIDHNVSDWAICVVENTIEYLYQQTYLPTLWHSTS